MINIAVVGLGGIGSLHARCYGANPRTKAVAVCDIIKERADEAADTHEARAFCSVQEMLAADVRICANQVRLSRCTSGHVLAYNLGNFLRRFALPASVRDWTLISARRDCS